MKKNLKEYLDSNDPELFVIGIEILKNTGSVEEQVLFAKGLRFVENITNVHAKDFFGNRGLVEYTEYYRLTNKGLVNYFDDE